MVDNVFLKDPCSERSTQCTECGTCMNNLKSRNVVYFESLLDGWDDRHGDCAHFFLSECPNCKISRWGAFSEFYWGCLPPEDFFDSPAEETFFCGLLEDSAGKPWVTTRPQVAIKHGDSYFFMNFVQKFQVDDTRSVIIAHEVDGVTHYGTKEYDKRRDIFLLRNGVDVVYRHPIRYSEEHGFHFNGNSALALSEGNIEEWVNMYRGSSQLY